MPQKSTFPYHSPLLSAFTQPPPPTPTPTPPHPPPTSHLPPPPPPPRDPGRSRRPSPPRSAGRSPPGPRRWRPPPARATPAPRFSRGKGLEAAQVRPLVFWWRLERETKRKTRILFECPKTRHTHTYNTYIWSPNTGVLEESPGPCSTRSPHSVQGSCFTLHLTCVEAGQNNSRSGAVLSTVFVSISCQLTAECLAKKCQCTNITKPIERKAGQLLLAIT